MVSDMKCAMICFHKNVTNYPSKWIEDYVNSFYWQTVKIPIYEINYGDAKDRSRLFDELYFKYEFPTHAHAHNWILDKVFSDGYEYAFNTNIDDIYDKHRIEEQMRYLPGHDIISSNHTEIDVNNMVTRCDVQFSSMSVGEHFQRNHNIISHPSVVYSRKFWLNCPKLNPHSIPKDDMELWMWAYGKGYKFKIVPSTLVYHRIHPESVAAPRRAGK